MKKYILIIFASVLFIFEGNAQCNGGLIIYSGPKSVCLGQQITINNLVLPSNVSSNITYQWLMNGTPIYGETQAMQFVSAYGYGSNCIFQRQVTDLSNSCSSISNSVVITYLSTPVNTFSATIYGDDTICSGSNSSIITSSVLNPDNNYLEYQWYINDGYNGYQVAIPGATNTSFTPSNLISEKKYILQYYSDVMCSNTNNYTDWVTKTVMNCGTFSSAITGPISIIPNQTATYSVPASVGMQYEWTVIGGTIVSGQGTNTITVLWDSGANLRTSSTNYSVSVKETDATPESQTTTQDITMATATSINKAFAIAGISVFPNPIKDQFNVVMPQSNTSVTYTVYSTTGLTMQSGSFTSSTSGTNIQTSLPAGIYQLVLNYDGVFTSTRLAVY
jgi:hypothetical protein